MFHSYAIWAPPSVTSDVARADKIPKANPPAPLKRRGVSLVRERGAARLGAQALLWTLRDLMNKTLTKISNCLSDTNYTETPNNEIPLGN